MFDAPLMPGNLLLLHGMAGGWDELIILAVGVLLAVIVVKWTNRSSQDQEADDEIIGTADGVNEKQSERP
jgi:hypothetical protein